MRDQSSLLFQWSTAFDTFHKIFKSDWQRHGAVVCMLLLAVIITETAPFASSEITHTHTYTYVAFHIAFHLVLFWQRANHPSLNHIIHSTQPNPTTEYDMKLCKIIISGGGMPVSFHQQALDCIDYVHTTCHSSFTHLGTCCLGYLNGWCSCVFRLMRSSTPIIVLGFIIFCWLLQEVKLLF